MLRNTFYNIKIYAHPEYGYIIGSDGKPLKNLTGRRCLRTRAFLVSRKNIIVHYVFDKYEDETLFIKIAPSLFN